MHWFPIKVHVILNYFLLRKERPILQHILMPFANWFCDFVKYILISNDYHWLSFLSGKEDCPSSGEKNEIPAFKIAYCTMKMFLVVEKKRTSCLQCIFRGNLLSSSFRNLDKFLPNLVDIDSISWEVEENVKSLRQ